MDEWMDGWMDVLDERNVRVLLGCVEALSLGTCFGRVVVPWRLILFSFRFSCCCCFGCCFGCFFLLFFAFFFVR